MMEGNAVPLTELGAISRLARAWSDHGWPAELDRNGSGITAPFNAPAQGPRHGRVYRLAARSATVVFY